VPIIQAYIISYYPVTYNGQGKRLENGLLMGLYIYKRPCIVGKVQLKLYVRLGLYEPSN